MAQVSEIANIKLRVLDNPSLLAQLIMSVGTGSSNRPMNPYDAARAIKELIEDIKNVHKAKTDKYLSNSKAVEDAARRLGITTSTCQEFLHVLKMPPSWRGVLAFRGNRRDGRLPFTIARKLAPRYKSGKLSEDDLNLLMSVAVNQNATRDDIEDIVIYKDKNKSLQLTECVKHIMNLTPIIIKGFVTITDVNPALLRKVKSVQDITGAKAVQTLLIKQLGGNAIKDVQIKHKSYAQIVFSDKSGSDEFYNLAKKHTTSPNNLINSLLLSEIGDGL